MRTSVLWLAKRMFDHTISVRILEIEFLINSIISLKSSLNYFDNSIWFWINHKLMLSGNSWCSLLLAFICSRVNGTKNIEYMHSGRNYFRLMCIDSTFNKEKICTQRLKLNDWVVFCYTHVHLFKTCDNWLKLINKWLLIVVINSCKSRIVKREREKKKCFFN